MLPLPRALQDRYRHSIHLAPEALRQRISGALHEHTTEQPRRIRGDSTREIRQEPQGQPAAHPRNRRRQRTLPEPRTACRRTCETQENVPHDGVPQPFTRHIRARRNIGTPADAPRKILGRLSPRRWQIREALSLLPQFREKQMK